MKLYKIIMLTIGIMMLSSLTASAETEYDDQDDVWHYVFPYYQSQTVSNQLNSDIKEISAEISGDQITLSMTLWPGGTFTRGQYGHASYMMFYNTSDAYYIFSYSDSIGGETEGYGMGYSIGNYTPPFSQGEASVNGDTISVTMDKVGEDTTTTELHGLTWVWEGYGENQSVLDHWHDWVGDYEWTPELDPGDDGNGNDNGNNNANNGNDNGDGDGDGDVQQNPPTGTPGFETIAVIAAIGISLIILRRKRK